MKGMKHILSLEWKKFVLPIILLVMFAYSISSFFVVGAILDNHTPEIVLFLTDLVEETDEQNLTIGEVVKKVQDFFEPISNELEQFRSTVGITALLKTIDPLLPVPCELSDSPYCRYYMSKEFYDGLYSAQVTRVLLVTTVPPDKFVQTSAGDYTLNAVILIIEGYIISAIILGIYRYGRKIPWYRRIFRRN